MIALKSCPFCGGNAQVERAGSKRQSTIIACEQCGCRLETGEVWNIGSAWNTRHAEVAAPAPGQSEAIRAEVIAQGVDPSSDKANP